MSLALTGMLAQPAGAAVSSSAGQVAGSAATQAPDRQAASIAGHRPHACARLVVTGLAPAPPAIVVLVWFGKAMAATTFDAFTDYAIATVLALPPPGKADNVATLLANLVPGLSEAKKVDKIRKLYQLIDEIMDLARRFERMGVPGAETLVNRIREGLGQPQY